MPGQLIIDIFDVGQGDGMLVQFPDTTSYHSTKKFPLNGTTMIVDMGSTKNRNLLRDNVTDYLNGHTRFGNGSHLVDIRMGQNQIVDNMTAIAKSRVSV